ncbi:MAG: FAD-dependent oxidoreductase, partial [Gammaproteobacteria bacterium]|nr:FAD-dependent oxidoreductase [Gammaproteobacteria bacterium]
MEPEAHTGSYYAATVNQETDYPTLQGDQSADVCVIGAGFTGISTALHLAERGYKVCVVEANRVGWGASGRNGGQIIGGIAGENHIAKHYGRDVEEVFGELRWAGHDIVRERVRKYNIQCDLKWGYLDVAIKKRHMRDIGDDYERLTAANFPHEVRILSGDETSDLIGTDVYIGALLNRGNGHLHPLNLCIGEAGAAASLGAVIYEQSPVIDIRKGGKPKVVTEQGSVTADAVVLAGNAYHHLDPKLRGIMFPVNSFIVATEPLSDDVVQTINREDLAVCDPNFVLEYFRLSADKRLLFGGRFNYFGDDPDYIQKRHRQKLTRLYPQLANVRIDYAWGGTIGVPINRVPLLGRLAQG